MFCILSRNVKYDRKIRFQTFFFVKILLKFVLVIMFDYLIIYVFCLIQIFSRWRMFHKNDSSNSTKTTYQTWYNRHLVKPDESHLIKFDEHYFIKLDEWYLIKLDEWYFIKFNKQYLIKFDDDISSNSTRFIKFNENFVCFLEWAFLNDKKKYVEWNLTCYTKMSIDEFEKMKTDFVMSVLKWKLRQWHNLIFEWRWTSNYVYRFVVRIHNLT